MTDHSMLVATLREPLAAMLGQPAPSIGLAVARRGVLADSTRIFFVLGRDRMPCAVVLWSPTQAPEIVQRAMQRAAEARALLDARPARWILEPLAEGTVHGATYAVLPFCRRFSRFRPLWYLQRRLLRPALSDWLADTARSTRVIPDSSAVEVRFERPLARLMTFSSASDRLRAATRAAHQRLERGQWSPRQVLMHGDIWEGNLMIRPAAPDASEAWDERLALVDWGGAQVRGFPAYDLVRAVRAFRYDVKSARREMLRHCEIVGCEPVDLSSALCAALAFYFEHIEEWPMQSFLATCEACLDTIERVRP